MLLRNDEPLTLIPSSDLNAPLHCLQAIRGMTQGLLACLTLCNFSHNGHLQMISILHPLAVSPDTGDIHRAFQPHGQPVKHGLIADDTFR